VASRIRKLASETAVYGVSSVLGRAVNFLLFPFYSQVLRPEEFGIVGLIYAAFLFLNILYQYGMESAYLKFASDDSSDGVFSTAVWSLLGSAALFSTFLWFLRDLAGPVIGLVRPETQLLLGFAAAILFLDTAAIVPFAELRLSNRAVRFAVIRVTSVLVNVGANLILILGAGMGIEAILLANVAASATSLVLLSPVFREKLRIRFDKARWREMMRFALPFLPGGLGYAVTERVNLFFLENMPEDRILELYGSAMGPETLEAISRGDPGAAGTYVVGLFSGMVKLAVLAALGVQMFRYAWQPFFLNHSRDEDAAPLFGRIFLILTAGVLGLILAVSFFAAELVAMPLPGGRTLIDSSYWAGLAILPAALIGYGFQGWYYHFSAGAYITKRTRYFVPCTLAGATTAIAVNFLAVPTYGIIGAAWATSASYAVMAICLLVLIRPHYPVPYGWSRVLPLAAIGLSALGLWAYRPELQVWWIELLLLGGYAVAALATLKGWGRRGSGTL
jgi:O-antigen/teichoic acid export membrane protein